MNISNEALSFDDVILVPQYSDIKTRYSINTSVMLKHKKLSIPIISSPMSTITEAAMCNEISKLGGLGILHRYNTIEEQTSMLKNIQAHLHLGRRAAAVGVTGDFKERLSALVCTGLDIVALDVAHGDHILMKNAIEYIRKEYNDSLYIIAGNIATRSAYQRISDYGADAVRTSIGSGSICTTRIQTGHGMPTLQAIIDLNKERNCRLKEDKFCSKIIADGGLKNSGDIVKAIAAGADLVILGSMLSGTLETPGEIFFDEKKGVNVKTYAGMASKISQQAWKGSYSSVEGVSSNVPFKGEVSKVVTEIMSNVRSGMSYSGASSIKELQELAIFYRQTSNSHNEGMPHIYRK
ncbi:guanosine monophosphate reductase [archaeon]|nr:guanosine monophosphate reductase [archaeon]|tara:strand:- start:1274 stop:2326 length:1053 start_codon:yes stop_codon:yes gene_type:complete